MNDDDANLFVESMRGVKPLAKPAVIKAKSTAAKPKPKPIPVFSLADQQSLLEESLAPPDFNQIETGDTLTWHKPGIQKNVLRKLRQGHYAVKGELDLHGLNQAQAKQSVARFLSNAVLHGHSCVRIIHGKGNRSEYGPVLKRAIGGWLVKRQEVIAFASAPRHDGGTGAIYVLIKHV